VTHTAQGWLDYFNHVGYDAHEDPDRFAIWLELNSATTDDSLHDLADQEQEHFLGQYESAADFAEESMSNAYGFELDALPDAIRDSIDWSMVWDRWLRFDCYDYELIEEDKYRWFIWHAH
jgi:hypothetical protein